MKLRLDLYNMMHIQYTFIPFIQDAEKVLIYLSWWLSMHFLIVKKYTDMRFSTLNLGLIFFTICTGIFLGSFKLTV